MRVALTELLGSEMDKQDYRRMLDEGFAETPNFGGSTSSTRLEYLSEHIFDFTTYESEMAEMFAAKKEAARQRDDDDDDDDDRDGDGGTVMKFEIPIPINRKVKISIPSDFDEADWTLLQTMFNAYVTRWKGISVPKSDQKEVK